MSTETHTDTAPPPPEPVETLTREQLREARMEWAKRGNEDMLEKATLALRGDAEAMSYCVECFNSDAAAAYEREHGGK